jgi:hypothetical protein
MALGFEQNLQLAEVLARAIAIQAFAPLEALACV